MTKRLAPYNDLLLLIVVLVSIFLALASRGFDIGFIGDSLAYHYHFERYGLIGGTNWLVTEHWARHLLAGLFSAAIYYLVPENVAGWVGIAFLAHFAAAVSGYALVRVLFEDRLARALGWISAVIFSVSLLDTTSHFEFPTIAVRNMALITAWGSLLIYVFYLRRDRGQPILLHLTLLLYMVAFMTYEQSALFFFLYPLIGLFEMRGRVSRKVLIQRLASDLFLFPITVVGYLYLLAILFPGRGGLSFSVTAIASQVSDGLIALFTPHHIAAQVTSAFTPAAIPVTAFIILVVGGLFLLRLKPGVLAAKHDSVQLAVFAAAMTLVTLGSAAFTSFDLETNIRLLYPALFSAPLLILTVIAILGESLRLRYGSRLLIAGFASVLVAAGMISLLDVQAAYLQTNRTREAVLGAIREAVPALAEDARPYFLLVTNAPDPDALELNMRDINFPFLFDRLYGVYDIAADGVYPRPSGTADDVASGGFIVAEQDGIYSPLRPDEGIDPARLVVLFFDVETSSVSVLDAVPEEVLENHNIVNRAGLDWETNHALIERAN